MLFPSIGQSTRRKITVFYPSTEILRFSHWTRCSGTFSGTTNVLDPTGSFVVDHLGMPADPRVFHFSNPLPSYAVVGDDIWVQQSFVMPGGGATPSAWSTHQIEEISPGRDIAVVDFPLGKRTVDSTQFTQTNAILTNRRFP